MPLGCGDRIGAVRLAAIAVVLTATAASLSADETVFRDIPLRQSITEVQPMTGLVLWSTNDRNRDLPIQLEYAYLRYDDVIRGPDDFDWQFVESTLDSIASRSHQAVLRFYFVYPGKESSVPAFIKAGDGYEETAGTSEGKPTTFCDWGSELLQQTTLDFYSAFARRYDHDRRLAFLQTGFGLWAEYHIYDGPMTLGKTFPDKAFQARFVRHLDAAFVATPWSVSIDAADRSRSPLASDASLCSLRFGLFDDSFLSQNHSGYNAKSWRAFGPNRWQTSPAGGEISYYTDHDQRLALAADGPHGIAFEDLAARFHVTYMIADGQPRYQSAARIAAAGTALGYRFRVTRFRSTAGRSEVTVLNEGIAPLYHDAFVAVDGVRAAGSLRGLLPGEAITFSVAAGGDQPRLTIESDRLVDGQKISFNASL